jgi:sodium-type flagellar protein MotY
MNVHARIFLMFLLLLSANSFADYYQTPMQKSNWEVKQSNDSCQLKQAIPLYGSADFVQRSGEHLQFSIQELRRKPPVIRATLAAIPAPWIRAREESIDYQVFLDQPDDIKDYGRLAVYGEAAEAMVDALLQGKYPTFTYIRASSDNNIEETRVEVSSVRFTESYKEFSMCREKLEPAAEAFNLQSALLTNPIHILDTSPAETRSPPTLPGSQTVQNIQSRTLFFNQGDIRLNDWAKQEVIAIVVAMRSSSDTKALITSATAIAGKSDQQVFVQRARTIVKQLNKLGISSNRLQVKSIPVSTIADNVIRIVVFGPDVIRIFHFSKDNTGLNANERQRLDLLVQYMREYFNHGWMVISSHTDSRGSKASNQAASQRRAEVFKHYLIRKGVSSQSIRIKAYGEEKPIKSNRDPAGRAQNRRIVIDFVA